MVCTLLMTGEHLIELICHSPVYEIQVIHVDTINYTASVNMFMMSDTSGLNFTDCYVKVKRIK